MKEPARETSTKTLTGFWEEDGGSNWAELCLNFGQSMEEHESPELLVAAAKSVGNILGKKLKTPEATKRLKNRGRRLPQEARDLADGPQCS
jgi:hypothetical protein